MKNLSSTHTSSPWREFFYGLLTIALLPITIPLLILAAIISIPAGYLINQRQKKRERRLILEMRQAGRFIQWEQLEPNLKAGAGTLIWEQESPKVARVWWTADELEGSVGLTNDICKKLKTYGHYGLFEEQPANDANVRDRYLSRTEGRAMLTSAPLTLNLLIKNPERFREQFPNFRVYFIG